MGAIDLVLKFWPYILTAIVVVLGGWKIDRNATARERNKQAAAEAAARTEGQAIDDAVAGRSPDDNRKRLSKWSRG